MPDGVVRVEPRIEVTFLAPGGAVTIGMVHNNSSNICRAAETLKARYFVARDGEDLVTLSPIWAVFDLRRCHKDNPTPGVWTLARPVKSFKTETNDAAVMYALALMGKG